MAETILLIDQGNTRLKWVYSSGREIDERSAGRGDSNAFEQFLDERSGPAPDTVLISTVAGAEASRALTAYCESRWGLDPQVLESTGQRGGVRNAYEEPGSLGVDRWLAIVGAVSRYGAPVVIWDLGTATTIDAVDSNGLHLGGMIYPGPATMLRSLGRETQLRTPPDLDRSAAIPGSTTAGCISNGVFSAQLGALNQFLRHATEEMGGEPRLIVTGGAAASILPLLDFDCLHDPWLVFRGMLVG